MREIKFRAWDTTSKKMYSQENIQEYTLEQLTRLMITDDPYTKFMQFTGLQDINGVDIYEGDILRVTSVVTSEIVNVVYFMGNACFRFGLEEAGTALFPTLVAMSKEVIGNIHENPDMLEAVC